MAGRERSFNSSNAPNEPNKRQRPATQIACRICNHVSMNTQAFIAHISTHVMSTDEIASIGQKRRNLFFQYPIPSSIPNPTSQPFMRVYGPGGYNFSSIVPSLHEPNMFALARRRIPTFQTINRTNNMRVGPVPFGLTPPGQEILREKSEQCLVEQLVARPAWCKKIQPNYHRDAKRMCEKDDESEVLDLTLKL